MKTKMKTKIKVKLIKGCGKGITTLNRWSIEGRSETIERYHLVDPRGRTRELVWSAWSIERKQIVIPKGIHRHEQSIARWLVEAANGGTWG